MIIELGKGSYPYPKATTYIEMIENIMTSPEPNLPAGFSSDIKDFISHCVKKNPDERWTTVQLAAHPWVLKYSQYDVNLPEWIRACLQRV
jgi:serine/threonine protein kinase